MFISAFLNFVYKLGYVFMNSIDLMLLKMIKYKVVK